jgi:hypothetical protein
MKPSSPWRPTPALAIACLALFIALGGTVLAATKINGRTIKVKSLPGNRLVPGSVPGNRIAPHSLRGSQIRSDTLATVPNAAHADSADAARHAQTATAADHAADATTVNGHAVGCPAGRRQYAGACWDLVASAGKVSAFEAVEACAKRGGVLPDLVELLVFDRQPGVMSTIGGEWTDSEQPVGIDSWAIAIVENGVHVNVNQASLINHFRCVTPLLS